MPCRLSMRIYTTLVTVYLLLSNIGWCESSVNKWCVVVVRTNLVQSGTHALHPFCGRLPSRKQQLYKSNSPCRLANARKVLSGAPY